MKPKVAIIVVAVLALTGSAGAQWSTITFDESNPLTGVAFVSDSRGVVVGTNEFIYETRNGGTSFSRITVIGLDASKCCHSIRFIDGNIGWIGGDLAVLRTTKSGTNFGGTQIIGSTSARGFLFVSPPRRRGARR